MARWLCACLLMTVYFVLSLNALATDYAYTASYSASGSLAIKSWKTLRDQRLVKQRFDYSCGAASMATILNEFYGQAVTELELLGAIDNGNSRASFSDMKKALDKFGFEAEGFATSYEQLARLKIPVLVYLKYRKNDHFSVLRGIDVNTVWLADSSLGNRTFSKYQFLDMWRTRNSKLNGKFLAIFPKQKTKNMDNKYFFRQPQRSTFLAVQLQALRNRP